jgi:hypothetical protein
MSDVVVRKTFEAVNRGGRPGYLERVGGSFVMSLAGVALQLASQYLLYKWEDVKHKKALALADVRREVQLVTGVDSRNDGKLVHFVGKVNLSAPECSAVDPDFEAICSVPYSRAITDSSRGQSQRQESQRQEYEPPQLSTAITAGAAEVTVPQSDSIIIVFPATAISASAGKWKLFSGRCVPLILNAHPPSSPGIQLLVAYP